METLFRALLDAPDRGISPRHRKSSDLICSLQSRRLTIKPRHALRLGSVVCDRLYFVGTPAISWSPQTYKKYSGDPQKKEKEGRKKTHEARLWGQ
jgi:hypothetical protein